MGRFSILKCLLNIKYIFDRNEPRYLLNIIYIDPLIKWIQLYAHDKIFQIVRDILINIQIDKKLLKLDLDIIENDYLNNNEDNMIEDN